MDSTGREPTSALPPHTQPASRGQGPGGEVSARPTTFHVDADAFFAACHRAEQPQFRGVPLVVAGDPTQRRGVVLAASYEARPYGVRSGMPLAQALTRYPDLVVVAPDRTLYRHYSERLHEIFDAFTPRVEPFSIDEAWLDMQGALTPFGEDPRLAADQIRARVRNDLGITVSVGVSTNRHLAKQASALRKPDRTNVLLPEALADLLWPRPVTELFGCGDRTTQSLARLGISTIGDLAQAPEASLARALGPVHATLLRLRARGMDLEPVHAGPRPEAKSLSAERTLPNDVDTLDQAEPILLALANEVAMHLRAEGLTGRTVVLKYKTSRFTVHSARTTLAQPTALRDDLYAVARRLFVQRKVTGSVRLLGLGCTSLTRGGLQLTLGDGARRMRLAQTEDALRTKYGEGALLPARLLRSGPKPTDGKHPGRA